MGISSGKQVIITAICVAALLSCVQMAEHSADKQATEYCLEQGKTPVVIGKKVSASVYPKVAEAIVCVDETQLIPTNSAFGANLLPDPREKGARIVHVMPNSLAAKAGLRTNDLVFEYRGKTVGSAADLQSAVSTPAHRTS